TLDLQAKVRIRVPGLTFLEGEAPEGYERHGLVDASLGQAIFNDTLPKGYPFVREQADKGKLSQIVNKLAEEYPKVEVAASLDRIKDAGFHWATRSGVTVALSDVLTPPNKGEIIAKFEKQAQKVQGQFEKGLVTDAERRQEQIKIWTEATDEVQAAMKANFPASNTINRMVSSGARGNWLQIRNIAGIRGLVNNTKGEIMPRPIISSYREGLSVAEYFTATHGARKGLADTALRTADSGYLTRRLVDVSQDVIIREEDCGTGKGLEFTIAAPGADGALVRDANVENSVFARTLAADAVAPSGEVVASAGEDVGDVLIDKLVGAGVESIKVRSVLTCDSAVGVCAKCYGRSLATGKLVDIGEAVGIIAAQSIGEPGTQLTMRTFHTGGSASADDITQGLPRVQELFEARTPKGASPIAEADGRITIDETDKAKKVILTPDSGDEPHVYPVLKRATLLVEDGQHVTVGQPILVGTLDPKEVMRVMGAREVQKYLVNGVQGVYRSQGVPIHDKHIEVIVRQMLRKVTVVDHADTTLLPGELVDFKKYQALNRQAVAEGKRPASGRPELMGITKASLATESWLSAASFQETTRVLTQAAMEGKSDPLVGLKENVIIGKLIPAGTGLAKYRDVIVEATDEAKSERYPNRIFASDGAYSDADLSYVDFDSFSTDDFTPGTYN
ncbi:MAG TPA: DNA-directed RNA polymerase subunit beta', partial [Microbacterium sp.]|nr:DNA-directed RNA polymerase subunit beta' [Microbacterium sp.]